MNLILQADDHEVNISADFQFVIVNKSLNIN
jgi:hypothetical protein